MLSRLATFTILAGLGELLVAAAGSVLSAVPPMRPNSGNGFSGR